MEISAPAFSLRTLLPDDYDALIELWSKSGLPVEPHGRESRQAIGQHITQFAGMSFVALAGGRIVGSVLGTHDGRKGWINRLAVDPDFRRRGVAIALVRACDAAIRQQGIDITAALVESDNQASAALFRRLGYSDTMDVRYFRKSKTR